MVDEDLETRIHELDATVRVGKRGIDGVREELDRQLQDTDLVKVKFLRAALGGTTTEEAATELAASVSGELVETRGHTAVFRR